MLNENPQLSGKRRNEEKRRRKRVGENSIFVTDPVGEKKPKGIMKTVPLTCMFFDLILVVIFVY